MILFAPLQINLLAFKINTTDHGGQSILGSIAEMDVVIADKRNYGFGVYNGDANTGLLQTGGVLDPDALDSDIIKESIV